MDDGEERRSQHIAEMSRSDIHQLQKVQKYRTHFIQQHTTEKVSYDYPICTWWVLCV